MRQCVARPSNATFSSRMQGFKNLLFVFALLLFSPLTFAVSKTGSLCGGSITLTCTVSGNQLTCSNASSYGSCYAYNTSQTKTSPSSGVSYNSVYFRTTLWESNTQGVCASSSSLFGTVRECYEVTAGDISISYSGTDDDNDKVGSNRDNCPSNSNVTQLNTDGDTQGDACDTDDDNDGVADTADNCPLAYRMGASQLDTDGDGAGNVCDTDDDGDGVADASDACPLDAFASSGPDGDGDGICNGTDTDDDNDGIADNSDAFPLDIDASVDSDGDGMPDTLASSVEGFETGNLWSYSPAFPWSASTGSYPFVPHSGSYYATTGMPVIEGDATWMKITRKTGAQISYWAAANTASRLDFYVDGVLQATTNSWRSWTYVTVAVTPGQHELKWQVVSDDRALGHQAFLDDVNFGSALVEDSDDDNDGVADASDAYPLDPARSLDAAVALAQCRDTSYYINSVPGMATITTKVGLKIVPLVTGTEPAAWYGQDFTLSATNCTFTSAIYHTDGTPGGRTDVFTLAGYWAYPEGSPAIYFALSGDISRGYALDGANGWGRLFNGSNSLNSFMPSIFGPSGGVFPGTFQTFSVITQSMFQRAGLLSLPTATSPAKAKFEIVGKAYTTVAQTPDAKGLPRPDKVKVQAIGLDSGVTQATVTVLDITQP